MAITEPSLAFSAALILLAYLIGSVPFAVVVSKLMGLQDPRSYGSKNPGATNVLRTGNKTAAALTLLGDAAKGWFAVWLAQRLAPGITPGPLAAVAVAAFLGHLYPIFLGFKGGKGVATFLGTLIALAWPVGLACCATWLIPDCILSPWPIPFHEPFLHQPPGGRGPSGRPPLDHRGRARHPA